MKKTKVANYHSYLKPSIGFGLLCMGLICCGIPSGTDQEEPLGDGLNRLTSDYSNFSNKEAAHIKTLFSTYQEAPDWPAMPRRSASISESISNETGFKVGLETDVVGAKAGATFKVTFGMNFRASLLLIRTAVEGNDRFTATDESGKTVLNVQDGVDFVAFCSYAASVHVGTRFLGEISMFGNGVDNQTDLTKNIEVDQGSNFFKVEKGNTVRELQDTCLGIFREKVSQSVVSDLMDIVKMSLTYSGAKETDLKKAMIAAVYGPPTNGLKIYNEEWNIEKANVNQAKDVTKVEGKFAHAMPWYLAKWPQDVPYVFDYKNGKNVNKYIAVNNQDGWKGSAQKLAELIADEVYLEYKAGGIH